MINFDNILENICFFIQSILKPIQKYLKIIELFQEIFKIYFFEQNSTIYNLKKILTKK